MVKRHLSLRLILLLHLTILIGCEDTPVVVSEEKTESQASDSTAVISSQDGVKLIPINTAKGTFNVWTKRIGNNPKKKVLLLHGGPGGTHEFFDCFKDYLPEEGIEYILYDQLDSYHSEQPNDSSLWTIDHFVEEVEQVRIALNLDSSNFYLLGQSWGGILAMEYALKYQDNIKGLVVSNMVSSLTEYEKFAKEVLGPQMPEEVFNEIMEFESNEDYSNPRYTELVTSYYYTEHIMRAPLDQWPKSVNLAFEHLNPNIYIFMQGYSEFGITKNASLKDWDISDRLNEIHVPTLMLGAKYDTMDPEYMEWMSEEVQNGRSYTTQGSHLSQYDDPQNYFPALIEFIEDVDKKTF